MAAAALGSSLHELMQRLRLSEEVGMNDILQALEELPAEADIKKAIQTDKILAFFQTTDLGKLIQKNADKVRREAPFAMLETDSASGENLLYAVSLTAIFFLKTALFSLIIRLINLPTVRTSSSAIKVRWHCMPRP